MDDIGDYIYLIVLAIAGLSSLFKKKKKTQAEKRDVLTEMPDLEDVIPEIKEIFVPREPKVQPAPIFQPVPVREVKAEKVVIPSYENVSDFNMLKSKKTVKVPEHKVFQEPEPEEERNIYIELETADDAARAFVNAEIFNRRY